ELLEVYKIEQGHSKELVARTRNALVEPHRTTYTLQGTAFATPFPNAVAPPIPTRLVPTWSTTTRNTIDRVVCVKVDIDGPHHTTKYMNPDHLAVDLWSSNNEESMKG